MSRAFYYRRVVAVTGLTIVSQWFVPASVQAQTVSSNGFPVCSSPSFDPDGDGWGWENDATCVVMHTPSSAPSESTTTVSNETSGTPVCSSAAVDPDGDGWGWENNASCRVSSAPADTESTDNPIDNSDVTESVAGSDDADLDGGSLLVNGVPVCQLDSSDPDGDGWGWENNATCIVTSQSVPSVDDTANDGDTTNDDSAVDVADNADDTTGGNIALTADGFPICQLADSDLDGDGWGWENNASCRVIEQSDADQNAEPEDATESEDTADAEDTAESEPMTEPEESTDSDAQSLLINEFLAKNEAGLQDEDGDYEDWIELFNNGDDSVALAGWCLRDSGAEWCFPADSDATIAAGDYLVVFASDKDRVSGPNFHTNFKLSKSGEYLGLFAPAASEAVHQYDSYPEQNDDQSYGLSATGAEAYFPTPTPNAENSADTNLPPLVAFSVTVQSGSAPLDVEFDASESSDDTGALQYDWDFGDGTVATDATSQLSHQFTEAGQYEASLTVTDSGGKSATETTIISVDDGLNLVDYGTVIINEFLAANDNDLLDNTGAAEDWIELYNSGDADVSLAGWCLTDDEEDIAKWCFPDTSDATIAAGGYLVVFASGEPDRTAGAEFHADFKLKKGGEYLGLFAPDQSVASEFAAEYPQQFDDVSYGVDQTGDLVYFDVTTPAASNDSAVAVTPLVLDDINDINLLEGDLAEVIVSVAGELSGLVSFDGSELPDFATLVDNTDGTATVLLEPTAAGITEIEISATDGRFTATTSFDVIVDAEIAVVSSVNDMQLMWGDHPFIADITNSRLFLSLNSDHSEPVELAGLFSYRNSLNGYGVSIDGIAVENDESVAMDLAHGDTFTLDMTLDGLVLESFSVVVTNLPMVEIQAETIVDEPKNPGMIRVVDGPRDSDTGWLPLGIEVRGVTAQEFEKVPYGIELREDDGSELDLPLLGLRDNDGDWILDAAFRDQTFVRNLVSHDFYRMMRNSAFLDENGEGRGQSTIAGNMVEVVLNGDYIGVYVLSERIDRKLLDLSKVDVSEDETGERWDLVDFTDPDNGSMLIRADGNRSDFYGTRSIESVWDQRYPDRDDVDRIGELGELIDFVVQSTDDDFIAEIGDRIDMQSIVDMYLLRMFTTNVDTFYKNYYIARNKSMKWFFVPWDYDATFGMNWTGAPRTDSLIYNYPAQNLLVCRLFKTPDAGFNALVKARWDILRLSLFTPQTVVSKFSTYLNQVGLDSSGAVENARARNLARWPDTGNLGSANPELGDIAWIEQWTTDRLVRLDALFADLPTSGPRDPDDLCDPTTGEQLR